jgi:hypothetical protein
MNLENLKEQLEKAKKEGKVEKKKSKFLKYKTKGENINKLLKEAAYGDNNPSTLPKGLQLDTTTTSQGSKMAKGGRAGFKSGMSVCKVAKKGKGRAYGKNS